MKQIITSTFLMLFVFPILVSAHADNDSYGHHMDMMGSFFGGGMGFFGWFFMIIFWVAMIAIVVFLIKAIADGGKSGGSSNRQEDVLEILKKRYAKGEISKEEFKKMKKDIG